VVNSDAMLTEIVSAIAFALVTIVVPGAAMQRLVWRRVDPALVLPLGFVWCAGVYFVALVTGVAWLFPAACGAAGLMLLIPRGPWTIDGPSMRGALPVLLAFVAFFALTRYGVHRRDAAGDFQMDSIYVADATFQAGLTWELTLGYPPQVPGLSGFEFRYHFGSHLVRAAALRWAGLHPYASLARLEPTLGALALVLAWRALAFRMGSRGWALALAPWGLLASDASFWLALFPARHFWVEHLKGNLLTSLVLANSEITGLALLAGALVALDRAATDGAHRRGSLILATVLAAALPFFKVFLALPLLAALAWMMLRDAAWRRTALAPSLAVIVVLLQLAVGQTETVDVLLDPLQLVRGTADAIGHGASGPGFVALAVVWIATSIGLRWIGVPPAVAALRRPSAGLGAALAVVALIGWPLGLLLRISPQGDATFNDAFYFLEASGAVLWIFTAQALAACASRRSPALVLSLAAAVAFPSTVEFVVRKRQSGVHLIPAGLLRGMDALARDTAAGAVVLERPHTPYPAPPLVFIGRRVPYTRVIPYFDQFAEAHEVEHRLAAVRRFFQTESLTEAEAIAASLGARHVCLYEGEGVGFAWQELLEPIYDSPEIHVYRLRDTGHVRAREAR
jgi:hypothetical protein